MFSAEKLLALIDGLGGIVWEADPETFRFTFVSAQAEQILGYPASAWLDEPDFWIRHTHPDDVTWCTAYCLEASRAGRDHSFDYRMIAADGRVVWLKDIVSVRESPQGGTTLVGIALDVTSQKEQEAERRKLSRLYEALIENSSDTIALIASDGGTVYQSPSVTRQLGYSPDELVGRSGFDLVHPDDRSLVEARFRDTLHADSAVGPTRYRARHRSGSWRVLESIGKRFIGDSGTVLTVANTRDVTEVVDVQRALEAMRDRLAHASKMEAVGRLAGGVSHDFNNILTVIAGYADLVRTTLPDTDARVTDIEEIRRAAHRASLLTRQLLAFSRKQVLKQEVIDLNAVLDDTMTLVRRLIGEDIDLELAIPREALPVLADRSQIEQVVMNLVVNARDAMPLGGRLSIRTAREAGVARLEVEDTGCGIRPDVLERIFEPFYSTKDVGKGTGLGLSTVYGIVKQSGGEVEATSEVDVGSRFTIRFPVAEGYAAEALAPGHGPRGRDTVLVVEDEAQVRDLLAQLLTRLGYRVLVAADPEHAVELSRTYAKEISLLLTDVVMPHTSGPDLFARLSAIAPQLAVLYVSGYTGDAVFLRGVHADHVPFLQKPFTPSALARKIREVLDGAMGRRS